MYHVYQPWQKITGVTNGNGVLKTIRQIPSEQPGEKYILTKIYAFVGRWAILESNHKYNSP